MMIIEFPQETNWLEIKKVLSKFEKEFIIILNQYAWWQKEEKSFVAFRCEKKKLDGDGK